MTELLGFCEEHEVEVLLRYDFIMDAYILRMRKGRYGTERTISAELAASLGFGLSEKVILRGMVEELEREISKARQEEKHK